MVHPQIIEIGHELIWHESTGCLSLLGRLLITHKPAKRRCAAPTRHACGGNKRLGLSMRVLTAEAQVASYNYSKYCIDRKPAYSACYIVSSPALRNIQVNPLPSHDKRQASEITGYNYTKLLLYMPDAKPCTAAGLSNTLHPVLIWLVYMYLYTRYSFSRGFNYCTKAVL